MDTCFPKLRGLILALLLPLVGCTAVGAGAGAVGGAVLGEVLD